MSPLVFSLDYLVVFVDSRTPRFIILNFVVPPTKVKRHLLLSINDFRGETFGSFLLHCQIVKISFLKTIELKWFVNILWFNPSGGSSLNRPECGHYCLLWWIREKRLNLVCVVSCLDFLNKGGWIVPVDDVRGLPIKDIF